MIDNKIQDDIVMNCVSKFFYHLSPSPCEFTYSM